jgi:MFS family permease
VNIERRASLQLANQGAGVSRRTLPIVELSLFKRAAFSATSLASLLVGAALIIAMADIPLFIATVLGGGPIDSGLALLRLTVMIPVGAIIGGWLCARITCRLTAILGLIPAALGFWLMHLWPVNVGWLQITTSTVICGLGFGLVIAPIGTTAINAANNRQMGMASSTVTVLRMVGMILGLAALTSWGLGKFHDLLVAFTRCISTQPGLHHGLCEICDLRSARGIYFYLPGGRYTMSCGNRARLSNGRKEIFSLRLPGARLWKLTTITVTICFGSYRC